MIEGITYEEMLNISKELSTSAETISEVIKDKDFPEISDFVSTVEGYSKYLTTTVELYQDVDKALNYLASKKK